MKVTSFHVRATMRQGVAWRRAADAEGHVSVGTWLAAAADAYLKHQERAGRPVPLAWRRGRFTVDGRQVPGLVSHPLGTYRVRPGRDLHALVYLPTGRLLATLGYQAHCKALAAELARVWVRWDGQGPEPPSQDPGPILDRNRRESL